MLSLRNNRSNKHGAKTHAFIKLAMINMGPMDWEWRAPAFKKKGFYMKPREDTLREQTKKGGELKVVQQAFL